MMAHEKDPPDKPSPPAPAAGAGNSIPSESPTLSASSVPLGKPVLPRDLYVDALHGRLIGGKYRLINPVNHGGIGHVWAAHDEQLDAPVAVKMLFDALNARELSDRMVQEAQLTARLEHPNIVRIYHYGFTEWRAPYIVLELLEGHDLRQELALRSPLPPKQAVTLLLPILDGLRCAHEQRIVHRDLKPENIFLATEPGSETVTPKLVDFGIARSIAADESAVRITQRGRVFGSAQYLAPEQALGQDDVDQRADLWAFCAVLYECVSGRPVFDAQEPGATLLQVIEGAVSDPRTFGADEGGLWPILERGLTRDRSARWQDAPELGRALSGWLALRSVNMDNLWQR